MLKNIRDYWNVEGEPVQETRTTWRVGAGHLLKRTDNKGAAQNNLRLAQVLRDLGVPAIRPEPTLQGDGYVTADDGCYLLMERLPGSHITGLFTQETSGLAEELGVTVANIHVALLAVGSSLPVEGQRLDAELKGWISTELEKTDMIRREEWRAVVDKLCCAYEELPVQPIHRDLHFGNLLFEDGKLTGVLDFDLGKRDARVMDIAYFLLGLLLGEDVATVREDWLYFMGHFLRGYESVSPLEDVEKRILPDMMQGIELLFIAFWSAQGKTELAAEALAFYRLVGECRGELLEIAG